MPALPFASRIVPWVGALAILIAVPLWAYTPDSPEVQAMVNRGIAFLEKNDAAGDSYYSQLGGTCLPSLAVFKWTGDYNHPVVQKGVRACRAAAKQDLRMMDNYSLGIALIFLCDSDPALHRPEIEVLLAEVLRRQKSHGGWGYLDKGEGDTSQHQYAVLGVWMAARQGFDVPLEAKEGACNWLIRVQDPNGSYGYQGKDPGNLVRVPQTEQRLSLQVAAMGSLYITMELLGFVDVEAKLDSPQEKGLPPALQKKSDKKKKAGPITERVPQAALRQVLTDGNRYFAANYRTDIGQYQFYYLYGLERYSSFRELAENSKEKEPRWYNDAVNFLRTSQQPNGSWSRDYYGSMIETAFACLFLMRSTKKSIQRIIEESGTLVGGRNLPEDLSQIKQDRSGKVISKKEPPAVDSILSLLEDEKSASGGILDDLPDQLDLAADPAKRAQQLARLRRLAVSGPFEARLAAVKAIGRDRSLENVPALLYAITDPDVRVGRAAASGLRFISRKFDGPQVPENATPPQKQTIAATWKEWYLGIRPDGTLLD